MSFNLVMRNQVFGIFFYLLYLLAMVRPLIPLMEYYANYDYIANELCENKDKPFLECNGKCYLLKQIKKANHEEHKHNQEAPSIDLQEYPISTIEIIANAKFQLLENSQKVIYHQNFSFQNNYQLLLKPPQFS